MREQFQRTEVLFGSEMLDKLMNSHVIVFGIGGVGGFVVEALIRCGIGKIDLVDNDVVNLSNLNRQIIALHSTIGKNKVDVMKNRILDINPNAQVEVHNKFFDIENAAEFDFLKYDYIVDAIDSVKSKIALIEIAKSKNIPIISSMGTGNKVDPTKFEIADIYKTSVCPLARVMRTELKKRNIKKLKVVYSKEQPVNHNQKIISSCSFVPSVAGMIIASEVIKDLTKN